MSKFAHYHFVSNKDAKIRLIRMGEVKKNIFIVGCPSIEVLKSQKKIDKKYFLKKIGINIEKKFIIVIQHSVTSELENVSFQIRETVKALKKSGLIALFVSPNNDAGSTFILREIKKNKNFFHTPSLSLAEYKNLLENCFALIGNSSSGIHEASSFFKPVINLGTRQNGRLRSKNIIDCPHNFKKILKYLKLLNNHLFYKKIIKNLKNPYEIKNTSRKIVTLLKKIKITPNVLQKKITY
jgi:UDP-hydrolysing UDP-N-acetyl-D-glucosamine 2-epimerase